MWLIFSVFFSFTLQSGTGWRAPGAVRPARGALRPARGALRPARGALRPAHGALRPGRGALRPDALLGAAKVHPWSTESHHGHFHDCGYHDCYHH